MLITERIAFLASILWTILALIYQVVSARGGGRRDFSVRQGDPVKGVIYNFTCAMTPAHKETISKFPTLFLVGLLMHIGAFIAILKALFILVYPTPIPHSPTILGAILGIASFCGMFLFMRRTTDKELKAFSSPEDYVSILLTLIFIFMALGHEIGSVSSGIYLIYSAILFLYFPLGKLRHAIFFFVARADYGARLGYRGTYPATIEVKK
jgi:nitrate reductase gamma subunit